LFLADVAAGGFLQRKPARLLIAKVRAFVAHIFGFASDRSFERSAAWRPTNKLQPIG
jgi:hypothetical protein